jgi:antitoxin ParD1/3/4
MLTRLVVRLNGRMTNDLPPHEPSDEELRRLVMDGIISGEGSEVDEEYFDRLRTRIRNSEI